VTEKEEEIYLRADKDAMALVLGLTLTHLGIEDPRAAGARWVMERMPAVSQLRSLCEDFGDNDWPDNLHLADVIEKHLGRHLYNSLLATDSSLPEAGRAIPGGPPTSQESSQPPPA